MTVLRVASLGKAYRRYNSELKRVASWFGLPIKPTEETWVLQDINFSINAGESIGIVGQNGAGKSTLLKMITGTLQPTKGKVEVSGRIAAILELGMGFNPEFTGRQNAYHGLSMMGFTQAQIEQVMPELEAFAEVGEYFDHPVRTYSSGMQMRVAFAVATAFRPEILIVDEALSVGDSYFQHKSFDRIKQFREQGTTLLLVSHDRSAVQGICDRAILLERGFVIKDGAPEEVMDFYNALIAEKENAAPTIQVQRLPDGRAQTSSGTGEARLANIQLINEKGEVAEYINVGESVTLKVTIDIIEDLPELVFGYMIKDRLGQAVFGTNTHHLALDMRDLKKDQTVNLSFSFVANIGLGSYSVTTALHVADTHVAANYEWRDLALVFNVVNVNRTQFVGINWMPPQVECSR